LLCFLFSSHFLDVYIWLTHIGLLIQIKVLRYRLYLYTVITKGVIRIRKSKKDMQHNDQNKMDKRTNNDLQKYTEN
jgi:hypothetical protein